MNEALAMLLCYFLGSLPFGLWTGKITKGIDIRDFGSGNIGASNVLRTLGLGPALVVFALDTAKGFFAVVICREMGLGDYWIVAGSLLSVLGHTFSVFLRFRGGKGVATSLGVIIGLNPIIAGIAFGLWLVVVGLTRFISIASLVASISVPLQMYFWSSMDTPRVFFWLAAVAATAIAVRHTSNIRRLLNGTEPRIGQKAVRLTPEEEERNA